MDAETALTLIDTIIQIYRGQATAISAPEPVLHALASDRSGTAARSAQPPPAPPSAARPFPASRSRYTLRTANGTVLNLHRPTPAMTQIVDSLRKHPGATLADIVQVTGLKRSTVANLLSELRKQKVLETDTVKR